MKKHIYSFWIVWGWVVQQLFIFGWTIPLKIISYSLDIRLQVKDLCKSYTIIMLFACMFRVRGIRFTNRWLTVWKWYVYNRILLLYLTEVISYCLNALHNYQEQFLSSCIRGNGSWWISNRVSRWKTLKFTKCFLLNYNLCHNNIILCCAIRNPWDRL